MVGRLARRRGLLLPRITTNQIAVGFPGAMTDVTSSADLDEGVTYSWGRKSEFDDTRPGEFSFVLDNADGKFTPDNSASGLPEPLSEGMTASWLLGTRLVSGRIREIAPAFPNDESAWAQVEVTCDDALGELARQDIRALTEAMIYGATAYAYWPFDDVEESSISREMSQYGGLARDFGNGTPPTCGVDGVPFVGLPQAEFVSTGNARTTWELTSRGGDITTSFTGYPALGVTGGWVSYWLTPMSVTAAFQLEWDIVTSPAAFIIIVQDGQFAFVNYFLGTSFSYPYTIGESYFFSHNLATGEIYIDGALAWTTGSKGPASVQPPRITSGNGDSIVRISQLAHTANRVYAEFAKPSTETNRLLAIEQAAAGIDLTLSASLSERPVGTQVEGAALDLVNDVVATEQGYLYAVSTGSLTAPVQTVVVRSRTRPVSVSYSFDVEDDLDGAPEFVRDLKDMLSQVVVDGPVSRVTVNSTGKHTNAALEARVASASDSEDVLNTSTTDLVAWGEDRLNRGANVALRVATLTIDAMTTSADRSAALLALVPGDRIQLTGLPSAQLGFTTWDGWFLGADESHTTTEHTFALHLSPVLEASGVFDVSRFSDDGELTLSGTINSAVTTMAVATSDSAAALLETGFSQMPYTLQIDAEQVTVTAVTSATPQVVTMTRAANGTTAAAHTAGAAVSLADSEATTDPVITYNYFLNPMFTGSAAPVNNVNMTATLDTFGGSAVAKGVTTSIASASMRLEPNENRFACAAGDVVHGTCTITNGSVGARDTSVSLRFYDTAGATLGTLLLNSASAPQNLAAGASGTFTLFDTAPSGSASVSLSVNRGSGSGAAVADILYADAAYVGPVASSSFSGSSSKTPTFEYGWLGADHASVSMRWSGGYTTPSVFAF